MPVNTKAIKRRIRSVRNTRKITKAMEMVAAAKMRRAVEAALNTRVYAGLAWDLLVSLSRTQKKQLPLLQIRPVKNMLVIIITSNRGLCGSFNANIIRKTSLQLQNPQVMGQQMVVNKKLAANEKIAIDVIGLGKKGAEFAQKNNFNLTAAYTDVSDTPGINDILPIARAAVTDYATGKYDKVVVAYTDYQSTIRQEARLRQVLPISEQDLEKMIEDTGETNPTLPPRNPELDIDNYLFEPDKTKVLSIILPRLVEVQILQAVLESAASEHSARMMAMRNASDAADDMIKELNLNYNKARQAGITQEIAEITGGAAALE